MEAEEIEVSGDKGLCEDKMTEPTMSEDDANQQLYELWIKAEIILDGNDENIKEKAPQLGDALHKIVDMLIMTSRHAKFENITCEFCQKNNPFNKIYSWTGRHRECLKLMASEQLEYFNKIVSKAGIKLLNCKGVVIPLTLLLLSLKPTDKRKIPPKIEQLYVNILYHLSQRISNTDFLELLSHDLFTDEGFRIPKFTFFELLILYMHNLGKIGNMARDGILSCVKLSNNHKEFQQYISQESACVIIAGGLSARYSSLPTTLDIHSEDWHSITRSDLRNMSELQEFLMALDFCCKVLQAGSDDVKARMSLLIHDGFLKSVLAPALNQGSIDAQIAVMAYLDLFLRSITDERVMEVFLRVLLTEAYDNKPLINLLIYHINSESVQLSMVAMQLFKTLLELNCEDVIFHLIFRYLLPCHHILPNQKRTIKEMDFYCKSATMFLYLTPACCLETNKQQLDAEEKSSPTSQRSHSHSIKSDQSGAKDESPLIDRKSSSTSASSSISRGSNSSTQSELTSQERLDFMLYLYDAKSLITSCKKACRCWSAVYDGMDVITDYKRLKGRRLSSFNSSPSVLPRSSSSFESPEGLVFTRTLSNTSTDSDISPGVPNLTLSNSYTTECLGPFLNALFDKIECMIDQNLYVNLLLTSVVTRLACYPQPLLRSFLLNANLVIRPGVRSFAQILNHLSTTADGFVSQLDDHKLLITKAKQNLIRRESRKFKRLSQEISTAPVVSNGDGDDEAVCKINLNHKTGSSKFQLQRKEVHEKGDRIIGADELVSLSPFHTSSMSINTSQLKKEDTKRTATFSHTGGKLHPALPRFVGKSRHRNIPSKKDVNDMRKKDPTAIKNAVYCVVILEEFMKELAAVSIEQTLL